MKRMTPEELGIKEKFLGKLWIVRLFGFICLFVFPFLGLYMIIKNFFHAWKAFFKSFKDGLDDTLAALKWGYGMAIGMIFMKAKKRGDA